MQCFSKDWFLAFRQQNCAPGTSVHVEGYDEVAFTWAEQFKQADSAVPGTFR